MRRWGPRGACSYILMLLLLRLLEQMRLLPVLRRIRRLLSACMHAWPMMLPFGSPPLPWHVELVTIVIVQAMLVTGFFKLRLQLLAL